MGAGAGQAMGVTSHMMSPGQDHLRQQQTQHTGHQETGQAPGDMTRSVTGTNVVIVSFTYNSQDKCGDRRI